MFSLSLFQKEGFEISGCSFVSDLKLRSTSSAEKNFLPDEITWITLKTLGKLLINLSCYRREVLQPVPWKRLRMLVGIQIEILNGGEILVN